jgi:type II secretion system protein J
MRASRGGAARGVHGFTLIELLVALFITAIIFAMGYGAINQALKNRDSLQQQQDRLTAVQNAVRIMVQDFTQLVPRPVRDQLGESSLPCLMGSPNGVSLTAGALAATPGLGSPSGLGSSQGASGADSLANTFSSSSSSTGGLGSAFSLGSSASSSSSSSSSASSSSSSSSETDGLDLVVLTRTGWANPAGIQRPALERVSYRLDNGTLRRMHWPELDVAQATTPIAQDLLDHVKSVTFRYLTDARQWTDEWPPVTSVVFSPLAANPTLRMRPLAVEVTLELDDWGTIVRIIEIPT